MPSYDQALTDALTASSQPTDLQAALRDISDAWNIALDTVVSDALAQKV